jgi:Periplasmic protein TonB, links inner and outer membranes
METNSILSANILDILFDGRNKDYGAYDLRRTYSRRIISSLTITVISIVIFAVATSWKKETGNKSIIPLIKDITIVNPPPENEIILPPKPLKQVPVRTVTFTPPLIVIDKQVTEPPVENAKLDDAKIDVQTKDGPDDTGIIPPIEVKNSTVIEPPAKKETPEDAVLIDVQIPATFKGNWNAYVKKEIEKHMDELTEAGESGTCMVKFIVSKDGSISNVEAVTMKGSKLAEVVVNAIRKGPNWIPAQQNGTIVNAYRQQPVTFKITD